MKITSEQLRTICTSRLMDTGALYDIKKGLSSKKSIVTINNRIGGLEAQLHSSRNEEVTEFLKQQLQERFEDEYTYQQMHS